MSKDIYDEIYSIVESLGYERGSIMSYFQFTQCVRDAGVELYDIDIELFKERYNINIG